jgi:hypothetical protein
VTAALLSEELALEESALGVRRAAALEAEEVEQPWPTGADCEKTVTVGAGEGAPRPRTTPRPEIGEAIEAAFAFMESPSPVGPLLGIGWCRPEPLRPDFAY